MDKIKVSKEIGEALDLVIKCSGKKNVLDAHIRIGCWTLKEYTPLNKLSNWELAEILIKGYEIEETPEEELLKIYKSHEIVVCGSEPYFNKGIKTALHILGIKIKGIND